MANPEFVVTAAGLAAATLAGPSGPWIQVTQFKVGDGVGYTPTGADTALHGTLKHTGVPYSYNVISDDTLDILLVMDAATGPFNFGEIGLYLIDGTLFALAAFDTLQQKLLFSGASAGNRWEVHALIKLTQAPAIIQVTVTNSSNLLELPDWASLVAPVSMISGANAAIIHEPDPVGVTPMVIRESDDQWSIIGYSKIASGTITAATSLTFTSSDALTTIPMNYSIPKLYVAQFANGQIRAINSIAANVATVSATGFPSSGTVDIWESNAARLDGCCPRWADSYEYNLLAAAYNVVWGTPNGFVADTASRGWNETPIANIVQRHPNLTDWQIMFDAVERGATLTAQDYSDVIETDFQACCHDPSMRGLQTMKVWYDALVACMDNVIANNHNISAGQLESNVPAGGQRQRVNLSWTSITHIVQVDFASAAAMQGFFNSGGRINFYAGVINPQYAPDSDWITLLTDAGTTYMDYLHTWNVPDAAEGSALGLYDLTGSYQQLYELTTVFGSGTFQYKLEGKRTSATQLVFQISFNTLAGTPYGTGTTTATLTSNATLTRASSTVLSNPIEAYPTVSSTGTM